MRTQSAHQMSGTSSTIQEPIESLSFLEKEVEMGFFDHHFFQLKDGVLINDACQRINKCTCNCNHCSWGIL